MMTCLALFWEFFKIGLFAVGGGTATIPFLMDLAERVDWYTTQELLDMIAISQSTPGPIGVNMATYVGYTTAGVPGAVIATIGLVMPAFLIMLVVARLFMQYKNNKTVAAVFAGIRPAVAGLILFAAWTVLRVTIFVAGKNGFEVNIPGLILCAVLLAAMNLPYLKKWHPVVWIGIGAVIGIVLKL